MQRTTFNAMACHCEVVLAGVDQAEGRAAAREATAEVQRIETKYSRYRADSLLSRINAQAGGEPVACDDETLALLAFAETLHRASDGLFDITAGVLRRAWNFKQPRVPGPDELAPLLRLIGWPRVQRQGAFVRLPEAGMEIDFGGFGKEYAADRAGALLAARGLAHGYVNLGGDMRVIGPKPDGAPWMMGIQHPRQPGRLIATLPIERGGLATSGDYERFFELDGRRYCHILDPRTGMPATHWQTVSVLSTLAVSAGNLSTIAMLKGGAAIELLEAAGVPYLALDQAGRLFRRDRRAASEPAAATVLVS